MQVTHTNRKGRTFYLCQGNTKTGKVRYFFAREPKDTAVDEIPDGYSIRETVNGLVSLARDKPTLLFDEEIRHVQTVLQEHPKARRYRVDSKAKQITVYEQEGTDMADLASEFAAKFGMSETLFRARMQEGESQRGQFAPILRFTLSDPDTRYFVAERMRFSGAGGWTHVGHSKPIDELAAALIPTLGTDAYFELY